MLLQFPGGGPNNLSELSLYVGMVSMCGGCNLYEPWAAVVVGLMAGLAYIAVHLIMLRFQVIVDLKRDNIKRF